MAIICLLVNLGLSSDWLRGFQTMVDLLCSSPNAVTCSHCTRHLCINHDLRKLPYASHKYPLAAAAACTQLPCKTTLLCRTHCSWAALLRCCLVLLGLAYLLLQD